MPTIKYPELHYGTWYFAQCFAHNNPGEHTVIVFAHNHDDALERTQAWLKEKNLIPKSVHLYRKTYKEHARKMYDANRYIIHPKYEHPEFPSQK